MVLPIVEGPLQGVLLGVTAAVCWGYGDFSAKRLVDHTGSLRGVALVQGLGLLPLLILLVLWPTPAPSLLLLGGLVLVGLLGCAANILFFRSFEVGPLSLVSPISSAYVAITVGLALLVLGELPGPLQLAGILLTAGGTIVAALASDRTSRGGTVSQRAPSTTKGVAAALGAAVGFGLMFFLLKPLAESTGPVLPVTFVRVASFCVVAPLIVRSPRSAPSSSTFPWGLLVIAVTLDSIAFLAYTTGVRLNLLSVVAPVTGAFGGFTALFAYWLLGERLGRLQWAGILALLLGILILSTAP